MVGLTTALEGLSRAEAQFNTAASQMARTPPPPPQADSVDLSAAAVALLESRNSFEANTKMIKTADEMEKSLLDTLG